MVICENTCMYGCVSVHSSTQWSSVKIHVCMDVLVYTALHSGHLSVSVYGSQDFLSKKYTGCRICTTGLLNVFDRKSLMNQAMPNALKTKLCTFSFTSFSFTEHSKIIAVILKIGQCYKLVWADNLLCHSVSLI